MNNNYFKAEDNTIVFFDDHDRDSIDRAWAMLVVYSHVSVWKPFRTQCNAKRARVDIIGLQSAQHLRARLHEIDGTVLENAKKAVANLDAEWARVA